MAAYIERRPRPRHPRAGWRRERGGREEANRGAAEAPFAATRAHAQYAGKLPVKRVAAVLCRCEGQRGKGRDYLAATVRHLDELGIRDGPLPRLLPLADAPPR